MNFFARQDAARKLTRRLIILYGLAVLCIVLAVDLVVILLFSNMEAITVDGTARYEAGQPQFVGFSWAWIKANGMVIFWTSLAVLGSILLASLYKVAQLSDGGSAVAQAMGGVLVPTDVADLPRKQLLNVVEEVSIASGVPTPAVYVLEKESAINAFAAGFNTGDAAIAVSRGCLETLTREELQGVIAHEFSHIFNGDMRLNIRLMGLLFGIIMIGLAGRQILRMNYYSRSRKNGGGLVVAGLSLVVIGAVGVFFGRLIQAAVSRQREYLADASAVQFTRNPDGIAGALKKIAALSRGSRLESVDGEEVGHMLFADGLGRALMATHPPLDERIRAIEPQFDPNELNQIASSMALQQPPLSQVTTPHPAASGFDSGPIGAGAQDLVDQVGTPNWGHVIYAAGLRQNLDPELQKAAHSLSESVDLVVALLLDNDDTVRQRQLGTVARLMGTDHEQRARRLYAKAKDIDLLHRLPLIELAFPALRRRPRAAIRVYLKTIEQLIRTDGEISVFEFSLSKLISVYLVEAMQPGLNTTSADLSLREAKEDIILLFSVMAKVGHADAKLTQQAFQRGIQSLYGMDTITLNEIDDWAQPLSDALTRLDKLSPLFKQSMIEGLIDTLSHDGRIALSEVELLRAVCACIHCPMPPQL